MNRNDLLNTNVDIAPTGALYPVTFNNISRFLSEKIFSDIDGYVGASFDITNRGRGEGNERLEIFVIFKLKSRDIVNEYFFAGNDLTSRLMKLATNQKDRAREDLTFLSGRLKNKINILTDRYSKNIAEVSKDNQNLIIKLDEIAVLSTMFDSRPADYELTIFNLRAYDKGGNNGALDVMKRIRTNRSVRQSDNSEIERIMRNSNMRRR